MWHEASINSKCSQSLLREKNSARTANKHERGYHLFFQCRFNKTIWPSIMNDCRQRYNEQPWTEYNYDRATAWRDKCLKNTIRKLCFAASIDMIWKDRNDRSFGKGVSSVEKVKKIIKDYVRERTTSLSNKEYSRENLKVAAAWKIPNCIFKCLR